MACSPIDGDDTCQWTSQFETGHVVSSKNKHLNENEKVSKREREKFFSFF